MADLNELLERVKAAKRPSKDLDWDVYVYVRDYGDISLQEFTRSIDAAISLVERTLPGWHGALTWLLDFDLNAASFACEIGPMEWEGDEPPDNIIGHGDSMPLAILAALLTALIAKKRADG